MSFHAQVRCLVKQRRKQLRKKGIEPCKARMAYRVDLTGDEAVPDWARIEAIEGLSISAKHVWLTRSKAFMLRRHLDACTVTAVEFRRCPVCERVLLGAEAQERRRLNESCPEGRKLPCGLDCGVRAELRKKAA